MTHEEYQRRWAAELTACEKLRRAKKLEEAEARLTAMLSKGNPDDPAARRLRGLVREARGAVAGAIRDLALYVHRVGVQYTCDGVTTLIGPKELPDAVARLERLRATQPRRRARPRLGKAELKRLRLLALAGDAAARDRLGADAPEEIEDARGWLEALYALDRDAAGRAAVAALELVLPRFEAACADDGRARAALETMRAGGRVTVDLEAWDPPRSYRDYPYLLSVASDLVAKRRREASEMMAFTVADDVLRRRWVKAPALRAAMETAVREWATRAGRA